MEIRMIENKPRVNGEPVFWSHLEELRQRLIFCLVVVAFLSVGCYFFSDSLLLFLLLPLQKISQKAYFFSPYDAFVIKLQLTFWSALFLSVPLIFAEIWLFTAPGLYRKEKTIFLSVLFSSVLLFLIGVCISIFLVIPVTVQFFLSFASPPLTPLISVEKYLSFVVWMALSFGLAFVAPVFLVGLVKLGILNVKQLSRMRRYVVVGIFVFAAVITPSPDPFSQCILAIPLWLLFEASLVIASSMKRKKPCN